MLVKNATVVPSTRLMCSTVEMDVRTVEATVREWVEYTLRSAPAEGHLFDTLMDRFARILITEALNITEGNRSHTAKLIGLSRPTLLSKLEKYQIQLKTKVQEDEEP